MKERIKLLSATLAGMGIPGIGELHMLKRTTTADATYQYWTDLVDPDREHTSLVTAESKMTTGRNDTLLVTPDSHTLTAAVTWDLNNSHMVGMYSPAMMNQRARFGQSGNFTPMVTVSGYGNSFHNIYTMWGANNAANLTGWECTGPRNSFYNCHFAGPMNAAQGIDGATCFHLDGSTSGGECYFENCVFGTETVERTDGCSSLLVGGVLRAIFKNCYFLAGSDSGLDSYLIEAEADAYGWCYFDNCKFINISTAGFDNTMAVGLACSATTTAFRFLFSAGTTFHGVTDVIAAADQANVEFGTAAHPHVAVVNDDVYIGLPINPDHTSGD